MYDQPYTKGCPFMQFFSYFLGTKYLILVCVLTNVLIIFMKKYNSQGTDAN